MDRHIARWRVVICTLEQQPAGWRLPPAQPHERTDISGGIRTVHELAVACAATGRATELRAPCSRPVIEQLAGTAGACRDAAALASASSTALADAGATPGRGPLTARCSQQPSRGLHGRYR